MGFETTGKIHVLHDAKQITERFRKREFVLELTDNPRYPQHVIFQLTGDRCENLDGYNVGDEVKVEFNLRGREWRGRDGEVRYFNSLEVWKLERVGANDGWGDAPMPHDSDMPADNMDYDDIPF